MGDWYMQNYGQKLCEFKRCSRSSLDSLELQEATARLGNRRPRIAPTPRSSRDKGSDVRLMIMWLIMRRLRICISTCWTVRNVVPWLVGNWIFMPKLFLLHLKLAVPTVIFAELYLGVIHWLDLLEWFAHDLLGYWICDCIPSTYRDIAYDLMLTASWSNHLTQPGSLKTKLLHHIISFSYRKPYSNTKWSFATHRDGTARRPIAWGKCGCKFKVSRPRNRSMIRRTDI